MATCHINGFKTLKVWYICPYFVLRKSFSDFWIAAPPGVYLHKYGIFDRMCWKTQYFYECGAQVKMLMFSTHDWWNKVNFLFILSLGELFLTDLASKTCKTFPPLVIFVLFSVFNSLIIGIIFGVSLHLEYGASFNHMKSASGSGCLHGVACRNSVMSAQYVTSTEQA